MQQLLERVLDELLATHAIEEAIIFTRDGRILAARAPARADLSDLVTNCRILYDAAAQATDADTVTRIDLRGSKGSTAVLPVGAGMFLAVVTSTRTPESLSLELSRAARSLGQIPS